MIRPGRLLVPALALVLAACNATPQTGGGPAPVTAGATPLERPVMERRLADACVYRQYRVEGVNRMTLVDGCRCAARNAIKTLPEGNYVLARGGALTGPQDTALRAGIAACVK